MDPHNLKLNESWGEYILKKTSVENGSPKGKFIKKQKAEISKCKDTLKELEDKNSLTVVSATVKLEHSDHLQDPKNQHIIGEDRNTQPDAQVLILMVLRVG